MRPDDAQPATAAQWLEFSEAWRYTHLDLAPSETFRRMAIQEHERLLHPALAVDQHGSHRWRHALSKRNRRS